MGWESMVMTYCPPHANPWHRLSQVLSSPRYQLLTSKFAEVVLKGCDGCEACPLSDKHRAEASSLTNGTFSLQSTCGRHRRHSKTTRTPCSCLFNSWMFCCDSASQPSLPQNKIQIQMLSCLSGILVDQQEDMQLILSSRTISWSAPVLQVAGGESTISTSCYSCSKTPGEASDSRYFNTHTDFAHDSERRSCQIHQSEIPQTSQFRKSSECGLSASGCL